MVMDAAAQPQQPSPQSVGREFVRQYYTLLNKAPSYLHRFYNHNSSFIHGESGLVVGQKNINNRIEQLRFRDCHAKISQVDAQATLGNGVVVQVTGELSNDGQPMRRFMQTFVLAAQSPKNYYVHNDIFRYQDIYTDEENDGESRSENDEDQHDQQVAVNTSELQGQQQQSQPPQSQVSGVGSAVVDQSPQQPLVVAASSNILPQQSVQTGTQQQQTIYYAMTAAGGRPLPILSAPQVGAVPFAGTSAVPPAHGATAAVTHLNGIVGPDDLLGIQASNGQQAIVPQTSSMVQSDAVVPVAAISIPTQTQTPIAAVTLNSTIVTQNASAIQGFQQTPMLQQQLLQQQQQHQPPQRSSSNTPQSSLLQIQQSAVASNTVNTENNGNLNNSSGNGSRNVEANSFITDAIPPATTNTEDFKTLNEQQQEKYEAAGKLQQQQNEPKTYANLFKSSTSSSPSGFVNAAMQQQQQLQQQQSSNSVYQSSSTITSSTYSQSQSEATSSLSVYSNRNSDNTSMRLDNNGVGSGAIQGIPMPQRNNVSRMNKDFDQRRTSNSQQFNDNQQLFFGNIPHHATEEELKSLFAHFGNVVEIRILSKANGKATPGQRHPLNYGFITYEDSESVQNCLSNCPLYFPENSPDGQKLNVEEKKPRMRSNDMALRQSGMGNNNMNSSQRNNITGGGGPSSRSLSNSGNMLRNNNTNMTRGGTSNSGGGPRLGGAFNRNERSNGTTNVGGPQGRGGNNNAQSGGGSYGGRR